MSASQYRYHLEKGSKKHICPNCQKRRFVRYVDTETGDYLADHVGKCDRLDNCNHHYKPKQYFQENGKSIDISNDIFLKDGRIEFRFRFSQELKQAVKAIKSSRFDGQSKCWYIEAKEVPEDVRLFAKKYDFSIIDLRTPKPIFIPKSIFEASLKGYGQNNFVKFLNRLVGREKTLELIKRFRIGTSKFWEGANVFWIIDQFGNVVGGQLTLFDKNGNTFKELQKDGKKKRYTNWVHSAIKQNLQAQQKSLPKWLVDYSNRSGNKFPCLFGLHQICSEPKDKPIAIVEAPKTAIIASSFYPQMIWLAVGGLGYLNKERIEVIKGRNIVFFPDKGGYESWYKKMIEFGDLANFKISKMLEREGIKDGADLADYLIINNLEKQKEKSELPSGFSYETLHLLGGHTVTNLVNSFGYPASWNN